jgi:general secretion pathway protein B
MLLNDHLRGSDDKRNQETETKAVNPPIPVRVAAVPMEENILKETPVAPKQAETKSVVEESLQNYLDLPFLMKQQMPQLKISLHYYSSNPARRIVRINGNILHENDSIEDGLTVEEIKPTTAVLLYDGVLFELNAPGG